MTCLCIAAALHYPVPLCPRSARRQFHAALWKLSQSSLAVFSELPADIDPTEASACSPFCWLLAWGVHTAQRYVWYWGRPGYKPLPVCQGNYSRILSVFVLRSRKPVTHMEVSDSQKCFEATFKDIPMTEDIRTWKQMHCILKKVQLLDTVHSADWREIILFGAALVK